MEGWMVGLIACRSTQSQSHGGAKQAERRRQGVELAPGGRARKHPIGWWPPLRTRWNSGRLRGCLGGAYSWVLCCGWGLGWCMYYVPRWREERAGECLVHESESLEVSSISRRLPGNSSID